MAKKELFITEGYNKDRYTAVGHDISMEILAAIAPVLEHHARNGASIRELGGIAHSQIERAVGEYILTADEDKMVNDQD